ncbi:hypothetical protein B0H11DRAFT_1757965 [Mycena galericulata]|nr:hypothetical protein B0H11DRAFT_1757965 [Mycena galericulata]
MSHDVSQVFAAVYQAVYSPENPEDIPHSNEVINDIEGEGETIPDAEQDETNENTSPPVVFNISQLQEHLLEASKGVTNETDKEYRRLMRRCLIFLREKGLIKASDEFFTSSPDKLVPLCICAWIMHEYV